MACFKSFRSVCSNAILQMTIQMRGRNATCCYLRPTVKHLPHCAHFYACSNTALHVTDEVLKSQLWSMKRENRIAWPWPAAKAQRQHAAAAQEGAEACPHPGRNKLFTACGTCIQYTAVAARVLLLQRFCHVASCPPPQQNITNIIF